MKMTSAIRSKIEERLNQFKDQSAEWSRKAQENPGDPMETFYHYRSVQCEDFIVGAMEVLGIMGYEADIVDDRYVVKEG